jgi:hypothetical protein
MNIFEELIDINNRQYAIKKQIDKLVYAWLIDHGTLWTSEIDTEKQIGALYISPNEAYPKDYYGYDDFCKSTWGWHWEFTNDKNFIKIQYNTVKNQYLDIKEDNEKVVTFDELLKYKDK